MPASLASTLYAAYVGDMAARPLTTVPWDELLPETRAAWERVAEVAREQLAMKARFDATLAQERQKRTGVTFGFAITGVPDAQGDVIEPATVTWPKHAPGDIAIGPRGVEFSCKDCGKLVEVEAVRCSACVAAGGSDYPHDVIANLNTAIQKLQALADRRNDLLALIKAETGAYVGAQVHELAKAEAVIAKVEAILARARTA